MNSYILSFQYPSPLPALLPLPFLVLSLKQQHIRRQVFKLENIAVLVVLLDLSIIEEIPVLVTGRVLPHP